MAAQTLPTNAALVTEIEARLAQSIAEADVTAKPYPHWIARQMLPAQVAAGICQLPFAAPELRGLSGKREVHNATRTYLDADCQIAHPLAAAVAQAFQAEATIARIEEKFGATLEGTYLRAEFAQDVDGFWLEPHSDLGVKKFTLLLYLSDDPRHASLGTDIYDENKIHVGTSPFERGTAMIFVPSSYTIHGFERRPIAGVRQSLIINYVTDDWQAREQLAFPDRPIGG